MQAQTICLRAVLMTTMLGAVSPMAQTGILALEQPQRKDGQQDWDTFFGTWKMHLKSECGR